MKKFKMLVSLMLCLVLLVTASALLVACNDTEEKGHKLEKVSAKAATCLEDGYGEYYKCTDVDCGKLFSDAQGTKEITLADITVAALGHTGGAASCSEQAVCARCGQAYGELGEHDYSQGYKFVDGTGHYYECSVCGNKQEKQPHAYDQMVVREEYLKSAADCKGGAVYYKSCVCGAFDESGETFTYGEAGEHNYEWKSDDDQHWQECSVCNQIDPSHPKEAHNFGENYVVEESKHYHKCDVCGKTKDEAAHVYDQEVVDNKYLISAADCINAAKYYKSCTCGAFGDENATFTDGVVRGEHNPVWKSDDNQHWQECADCKKVLTEKTAHSLALVAELKEGVTFEEEQSVTADDVNVYLRCECGHGNQVASGYEVQANTLVGGENTITVAYDGKTATITVTVVAIPRYTLTLEGATFGDGANTAKIKEGATMPAITTQQGKTFLGYKDADNNYYFVSAMPEGYSDVNITCVDFANFVMPSKDITLEALYVEDMIYFAPSDYQAVDGITAQVGEHVKTSDGKVVTRFTWDTANVTKSVRSAKDTGSMPVNVYAPAYGKTLMFVAVINNGNKDVTVKYQTENYGIKGEMVFVAKANSTTIVPFIYSIEDAKGTFTTCDHRITVTSDIAEGETVALDFYGYIIPTGKLAPVGLVASKGTLGYNNGDNVALDDLNITALLGASRYEVRLGNYTATMTDGTTYGANNNTIFVSALGLESKIRLFDKNTLYNWIEYTLSASTGASKNVTADWISGEYIKVEGPDGQNVTATKYTILKDTVANTDTALAPWKDATLMETMGINLRIPSLANMEREMKLYVTNYGDEEITFRIYAENSGDKGGVDVVVGAKESKSFDFTVNPGKSQGSNYNIKMLGDVKEGAQFSLYGYYKPYDGEIVSIGINSKSTHKKTFAVGDTFNADKLAVDVTGSLQVQSNLVNITNFVTDLDGYVFTSADVGTKTVTVFWNGISTTYTITITE